MTREEVSQIYYLNREIRKLQRKLEELRCSSLQSPKIDGMPRAPGRNGSPTERKGVAEADLEAQIEKLLAAVKRKQREIFEYIGSVDDSLIRMIIIFRCVDLCTWEEVARHIGGPTTADSARMAFNRHFEAEESGKKSTCSFCSVGVCYYDIGQNHITMHLLKIWHCSMKRRHILL